MTRTLIARDQCQGIAPAMPLIHFRRSKNLSAASAIEKEQEKEGRNKMK